MPEKAKSSLQSAHQVIFAALEPLSAEDRGRVLTSVTALLEVTGAPATGRAASGSGGSGGSGGATATRPKSLVEVVQEKQPGTVPQRITLFAYYRERHEGIQRFERDDLKSYFPKIHERPPANYDRDFMNAVLKGWIHEDGGDSYITSKGIEAVEAGFPGERKMSARSRRPRKPKKKARRT